jgi:hypothetical protein
MIMIYQWSPSKPACGLAPWALSAAKISDTEQVITLFGGIGLVLVQAWFQLLRGTE